MDRIEQAGTADLDVQRHRFGGFNRVPVVITGASGAGKTRIWARLTGNTPIDQSSITTDDGYMLTRRSNRKVTLTTIPGQLSRSRFYALEELFGTRTRLEGVIFVASNGFDRTWTKNADLVASSLSKFEMGALMERNKREELSNFRDICDRIIQKRLTAPEENLPRWLLVVANKLDLYWDKRDEARDYYRIGSQSSFAEVADNLLRRLGTISFNYHILPVATGPSGFVFDSTLGRFEVSSTLSLSQCNASLIALAETIGEFSGI